MSNWEASCSNGSSNFEAMQLEFLGTGTSQGVPVLNCDCDVCSSDDPRDDRLRCAVLFRTDSQIILVDGGPDMRQQLLRTDVPRLDAVLLTHEHMDHISGMDDLRSYNFKQKRAMPIYANPATAEVVERVYAYAFGENNYPGIPQFDLQRIGKAPFMIGPDKVVPIEVLHYKLPVFGYRIGDITYITDAKTISAKQMQKIEGSKVLAINALRREEHISHLNLDEALELIERIGPEQAYLTHISHLFGQHAEIEQELPSNVHVAYDGLVVDA